MSNLDIHICNCGTIPKLIYTSPCSIGGSKRIQVKCPNCKAGTHVRNNSVNAIEEWNGRFELWESANTQMKYV